MKVLVTGAAGFIDSDIVEVLLKRGETVRVVDSFSIGRQSRQPRGHRCRWQRLADMRTLVRLSLVCRVPTRPDRADL
jgi:nucleoside-diphosphate-sugar epimerase